jgi:PAS domain S-box-containing protein
MSQTKKFDAAQFEVEGGFPLQHPLERLESYQMANEFGSRREQRFSIIFDQSSHFMALLNLDGTLVEVNQALLEFAGVSADIVLGHLFWQTLWWAEASQASLQAAIAQAVQGQPVDYETELLGEGDRVLTIDLALKLVQDEAGKERWLLAEGRDITKRKQAEAEIQRLNAELAQRITRRTEQLEVAKAEVQLYADIVQNMQMAIHVWHLVDPDDDTSLELVTTNPIAVQIAQRPLDAMIGKRILECFPAMPSEQVAQIAEIARNGERRVDLEVNYSDEQIADGFYTCHVFPLPGRCIGAAIEDITDRKQAELALQESERLFATIASLSPVGIFRMDETGEMVYANDRWHEITGSPESVPLGQAWREALHPDDRSRVFAEWEEARCHQQPYCTECRFLRSDGSVVWVLGQVTPKFSGDLAGNLLIGYVGTLTDISDRKQAEEDLKESERRYATLTKLASVGISRINTDGDRVYVNDRWGEIAGLSPHEALAKGWQDAMHPDDATRILPEWEAAFRERQPYFCECRFIHPNGEIRWVMGQALPDVSEDGKFLGYVSTITDITDRKRSEMDLQERADELSQVNQLLTRTSALLEERNRELSQVNQLLTRTSALLEERNRELDQFAYVTSHDLKAPLRAIANLSEWIEDDLAGTLPPENQRQMELLRGRVFRMESLINGLLQYSRVGRTQVETETVSVHALLTEVVDSIDPLDTFTVTIGEGMPTLQAKSLLLRQVFANLIGNAIKHHPRSDGQVSIAVQDQGSFYEFAVSDDGQGIASEHHEKIFDIFHTLEARDTKESTGIGLSIVKKIVEAEGGSIRVESQVGSGTTFRFTWMKHPKVH